MTVASLRNNDVPEGPSLNIQSSHCRWESSRTRNTASCQRSCHPSGPTSQLDQSSTHKAESSIGSCGVTVTYAQNDKSTSMRSTREGSNTCHRILRRLIVVPSFLRWTRSCVSDRCVMLCRRRGVCECLLTFAEIAYLSTELSTSKIAKRSC